MTFHKTALSPHAVRLLTGAAIGGTVGGIGGRVLTDKPENRNRNTALGVLGGALAGATGAHFTATPGAARVIPGMPSGAGPKPSSAQPEPRTATKPPPSSASPEPRTAKKPPPSSASPEPIRSSNFFEFLRKTRPAPEPDEFFRKFRPVSSPSATSATPPPLPRAPRQLPGRTPLQLGSSARSTRAPFRMGPEVAPPLNTTFLSGRGPLSNKGSLPHIIENYGQPIALGPQNYGFEPPPLPGPPELSFGSTLLNRKDQALFKNELNAMGNEARSTGNRPLAQAAIRGAEPFGQEALFRQRFGKYSELRDSPAAHVLAHYGLSSLLSA